MKTSLRFFSFLTFLLVSTFINSKAQTYFSGGIYTNTTWALANSPYILTDTVVVFPGVTLTIDPGVIIKCDTNVMLEIRQASLFVNGANGQPVIFAANKNNASMNYWKGIALNNADTCDFRYCNVSNANIATKINSALNYNLLFKHCDYYNNIKHILTSSSNYNSFSKVEVDSCNFIKGTTGIDFSIKTLLIKNTTIQDFNIYGVKSNGFIYQKVIINNSNILKNDYGLYLTKMDTVLISNTKISNNFYGIYTVSNNNFSIKNSRIFKNKNGIYGHSFRIENSLIDSNIIIGVNGNSCQIINNFLNANNIGFSNISGNNNNFLFKYNNVFANRIGISASSSLDSIYCNKIYNDTLYDFYYNNTSTNSNGHIGSNDWGTTNTALIDAKFYDGYDNVSLGLVNYLPIDTSQCYLSSCNLVLTPLVTNASCDTCHNGAISVVASNGGAPYHFTWYTSPLQTTSSINHLSSGNYTYCVTDVRGCTMCDTVFVDSVNCNLFKASASILNASCSSCNNGGAHITTINGNAPYTYAWTSSPLQTTDSLKNVTWGTYAGCVADSKGCISCDTIFIDSSRCNHLAIQLFSNGVSCKTCNDGSAWVKVNGGNAPFSYHWNTFPALLIDSIFSRPFGMHSVCVTDVMNCQSCDSVFIDSINCNGFTATFNKINVSCNTCNDGKAWIIPSGGTQPYSYSWSNGNNNDTIFNLHQNIYTACITDNIGCSICNSVIIDSINCSSFHVVANGTNTTCGTCANGKAWATAIGGGAPYNYTWNTSPISTNDTIKNILVGNYIVTATDIYSCVAKDTITIDSTLCFGFQTLINSTNPSCITCTNGAISLLASGGKLPYHYTWYTSPMHNTSSITGLSSGFYSYCVNDANGCAICDTVDLTQYCSAQFNLSPHTSTPHHYFATNLASGINPIQYSWSWGDGTPNDTGALPTHTYNTPGFYTICLSIIDANGCTNNYCDSFYLMRSKNPMVVITVIKKPAETNGLLGIQNENAIKIFPNPTHDDLNIEIPLSIKQATLSIYSLLGQLVYNKEVNLTSNKIDISKWNNGTYILQISNQDVLIREKINKN